jgi:hypothetical protein
MTNIFIDILILLKHQVTKELHPSLSQKKIASLFVNARHVRGTCVMGVT